MRQLFIGLILVFVILPETTLSQNLVNNWSFEDTISCPINQGNIDKSFTWSSFRNTPDYFHGCSQIVGTPQNIIDYQNPRTGLAYSGFYAFSTLSQNAREVLGCELLNPLQIGNKYFVKFYVVKASKPLPGWRIDVAVDKIGVKFTTQQYSSSNPINNDNFSQVYSSFIINDTVNWTEISGSFISDSNYQYVSISNFFEDINVNIIQSDSINTLSYYFLDDICISSDSIYCEQLLNIEDNSINNFIKIFPNPARDWIVVRGADIKSLLFYDVSGRVIFTFSTPIPATINLSSVPSGLYLVALETKNGLTFQKLIINN